MNPLLKEIRHNRMLWFLIFVPVAIVVERLKPGAHTLSVGIVLGAASQIVLFVGVLLLMIYVIFAMMLYLAPPRESFARTGIQTAYLDERP
jgi:hypothetical protein